MQWSMSGVLFLKKYLILVVFFCMSADKFCSANKKKTEKIL